MVLIVDTLSVFATCVQCLEFFRSLLKCRQSSELQDPSCTKPIRCLVGSVFENEFLFPDDPFNNLGMINRLAKLRSKDPVDLVIKEQSQAWVSPL